MSTADLERLFGLGGKTALVTGGTRGIGMMIARGLLQAGASVVISSRKSDAVDDAVAGRIEAPVCDELGPHGGVGLGVERAQDGGEHLVLDPGAGIAAEKVALVSLSTTLAFEQGRQYGVSTRSVIWGVLGSLPFLAGARLDLVPQQCGDRS